MFDEDPIDVMFSSLLLSVLRGDDNPAGYNEDFYGDDTTEEIAFKKAVNMVNNAKKKIENGLILEQIQYEKEEGFSLFEFVKLSFTEYRFEIAHYQNINAIKKLIFLRSVLSNVTGMIIIDALRIQFKIHSIHMHQEQLFQYIEAIYTIVQEMDDYIKMNTKILPVELKNGINQNLVIIDATEAIANYPRNTIQNTEYFIIQLLNNLTLPYDVKKIQYIRKVDTEFDMREIGKRESIFGVLREVMKNESHEKYKESLENVQEFDSLEDLSKIFCEELQIALQQPYRENTFEVKITTNTGIITIRRRTMDFIRELTNEFPPLFAPLNVIYSKTNVMSIYLMGIILTKIKYQFMMKKDISENETLKKWMKKIKVKETQENTIIKGLFEYSGFKQIERINENAVYMNNGEVFSIGDHAVIMLPRLLTENIKHENKDVGLVKLLELLHPLPSIVPDKSLPLEIRIKKINKEFVDVELTIMIHTIDIPLPIELLVFAEKNVNYQNFRANQQFPY